MANFWDTEKLANGWVAHFQSADRDIEWLDSEVELETWLDDDTVLISRIDAIGRTDNDMFFGEWKTSSGRDRSTWKQTWRLHPQSLTYGVAMQSTYPDCHRFTVRKAFKTNPYTYDHAWYRYSDTELTHWRNELRNVAREHRQYVKDGGVPWPTNFRACFEYGVNYACPFFENGCGRGAWGAVPQGAAVEASPAEAALRSRLNGGSPSLVVLSASRVERWLQCRERYRKEYVEGLKMPPSEAQGVGQDFHSLLGGYYKSLVKESQ